MAELNQGIINYGSIGGNASVHIVQRERTVAEASSTLRSSGQDPELVARLVALIGELQLSLKAVPQRDAASADAVASALKKAMQEVASGQKADKGALSVSAKGLLEAAQGLAGVMPIALKIAAALTAAFGLSL